jgi:perosamine synthetase
MGNKSTSTLAINGGDPVRTTPMPPRHMFGDEEKQAAMALFDASIESGNAFGYGGPQEDTYCKEFAEFLGGGYADGVNSGTTAVYVALRALDLEPFTEVIVPPVTDMGGVMPVPLMNCIPIPADTAPGTYNVGPEQIEARITDRTGAIVVAHIGGIPVDMDPIMEMAHAKGILVVEDCAQAHGAVYKGKMAGTLGDVAPFSTMSGKHHATAAQGGVVFTKREDLYWKIRQCADRGKPFGVEGAKGNVSCSLNLNLNDLAAVVGSVQLAKLPASLERIRAVADTVIEGCKSLQAVDVVTGRDDCESAFWFLVMRIDPAKLSVGIDTYAEAVRAEGISASAHYVAPFTTNDWYKNRAVFGTSGYPWTCPLYTGDPDQTYPLPNYEAGDEMLFLIKIHEGMTTSDAEDVVKALAKVEAAYLK